MNYYFQKKVIDFFIAFLMLFVFLSLLPFIYLCSLIFIDGSFFFVQKRIGIYNRPFYIYKLRTLPYRRFILPRFYSSFLRSTAIDELPQCINIILGDMSVVGPRPLLPEYLKLYSSVQIHRHDVLPGITGLSQILGRNNITWHKKFRYDLYYVRHQCLRLDFYILLSTVKILLQTPFGDPSSEPVLEWKKTLDH